MESRPTLICKRLPNSDVRRPILVLSLGRIDGLFLLSRLSVLLSVWLSLIPLLLPPSPVWLRLTDREEENRFPLPRTSLRWPPGD